METIKKLTAVPVTPETSPTLPGYSNHTQPWPAVPMPYSSANPYYPWPAPAPGISENGSWIPGVNVYGDDKGFTVEAPVPGMTRSNCKVWTDKGTLYVTCWKSNGNKHRSTNYFHWTCRIPGNVNYNRISARCTNGVLSITFPAIISKTKKDIPVS